MKIRKLMFGLAAATVAIAIGGGVAFAVWSTSGAGSGAAAATVAQSLVVTPETPSGANASMYPGGPAGGVYFTIQNPNLFAVTVTSVTWGTPTSTNTSSCASSNLELDANAPTSVSISIPAASTTGLTEIPGVIDLLHSAPPGCQAVAFDDSMTISATQQ